MFVIALRTDYHNNASEPVGLGFACVARGWLLLALLSIQLGCDPKARDVRGPNSEPVQSIEASRIALQAGGEPEALPLIAAAADQGKMPTAQQLVNAMRSAAPDGALLETVQTDATGEPVAVLVRLQLAQYMPVLIGGASATDGVQALTAAGASVVLGSPFVAEFSPLQPLGLLQVEGQVINELQPHGYTRVLGLRDDSIGIVGRREFHRGMFDSALQVGPGIIEKGALDISKRELKLPAFFRTFLVHCQGEVLLGATTMPMHLRTLGADLLEYASAADLSCDEAVNLSGDREVLLGVRNDSHAVVFGNPRVKKTALIGFIPRVP